MQSHGKKTLMGILFGWILVYSIVFFFVPSRNVGLLVHNSLQLLTVFILFVLLLGLSGVAVLAVLRKEHALKDQAVLLAFLQISLVLCGWWYVTRGVPIAMDFLSGTPQTVVSSAVRAEVADSGGDSPNAYYLVIEDHQLKIKSDVRAFAEVQTGIPYQIRYLKYSNQLFDTSPAMVSR